MYVPSLTARRRNRTGGGTEELSTEAAVVAPGYSSCTTELAHKHFVQKLQRGRDDATQVPTNPSQNQRTRIECCCAGSQSKFGPLVVHRSHVPSLPSNPILHPPSQTTNPASLTSSGGWGRLAGRAWRSSKRAAGSACECCSSSAGKVSLGEGGCLTGSPPIHFP